MKRKNCLQVRIGEDKSSNPDMGGPPLQSRSLTKTQKSLLSVDKTRGVQIPGHKCRDSSYMGIGIKSKITLSAAQRTAAHFAWQTVWGDLSQTVIGNHRCEPMLLCMVVCRCVSTHTPHEWYVLCTTQLRNMRDMRKTNDFKSILIRLIEHMHQMTGG